MERSARRRDGGERAWSRPDAWRLWCRFGESEARGWLGRRRVAAALRCAAERGVTRLGGRAAVELPRRAVERRQLLLPRGADRERRDAVRWVLSAAARA